MGLQSPIALLDSLQSVFCVENDADFELQGGAFETSYRENKETKTFEALGQKPTCRLGELRHELVEFHLHSPAEHPISGVIAPLEIHFVFQQPGTCGGSIVVFGVLIRNDNRLREGRSSPFLERLVAREPLPASLFATPRSYVMYDGTTTTEPFAPVKWVLKATTAWANDDDLQVLQRVAKPSRPVQERRGRIVVFKKKAKPNKRTP